MASKISFKLPQKRKRVAESDSNILEVAPPAKRQVIDLTNNSSNNNNSPAETS